MKTFQTMACAIAFAVPHAVAAQTNPPEDRSAATTTSQLTYKSVFQDYRPYADVPVADWRQVNDVVRNAAIKGGGQGGHGAQGSKGSEDSAASKEDAPRRTPAQTHEGPGMHGGQR